MPRLSMVLLGAAFIDVALRFWSRYLFEAHPDISVPIAVGNLLSAMPFVLAASIAAGWRWWTAGHGLLAAAVAAYAAAGGLNAAGQVGLAVILGGELPPNTASLAAVSTAATLGNLAAGSATLLAAAGLRRGAASRAIAGWRARASRIAIAVAVLVTGVATVAAARVLTAAISSGPPAAGAISYVAAVVFELAGVPLAVLGVVAIRRLPNRYLVPELLIGIGALAASVAWLVWSASTSLASNPTVISEGSVATAMGLQLLAMVVVALGFFAARVSAAGEMEEFA